MTNPSGKRLLRNGKLSLSVSAQGSVFFLLLIGIFLGLPANGQTGSIQGKVLDVRGAPVDGATVYAVNQNRMDDSPVTSVTDGQGNFKLTKVPVGQVYVNASKSDSGQPYSLFAFYNLPGEQKPKVLVLEEQTTERVVVRLGESVGYFNLKVVDQDEHVVWSRLVFTRADQPGEYKRSFAGEGEVPIPPVPVSLTVTAVGFAEWHLTAPDGSAIVRLSPGVHRAVTARLVPLKR